MSTNCEEMYKLIESCMQQNTPIINNIIAIEESTGCDQFMGVDHTLYIMDGHRRCETYQFDYALSDLVKKYGYTKDLKCIESTKNTTWLSGSSYSYTLYNTYKVSLTPSINKKNENYSRRL